MPKITELSEITTTSGSDILYVIDNSSGSAVSKKITVENFSSSIQVYNVASKIYMNLNFK